MVNSDVFNTNVAHYSHDENHPGENHSDEYPLGQNIPVDISEQGIFDYIGLG
jgi:hypothetical protein